jgi:signal peptidase I
MKKSKLKILSIEITLLIILFIAMLFQNTLSRWVITIIIATVSFVSYKLLKNRKTKSHHKRVATILMALFGLIYLGILYLLGLHYGYVQSKILLSFKTITNIIVPISVMIISSELMRNVLLSHDLNIAINKKEINISPIMTFLIMVLIDILIYAETVDFTDLNSILTAMGYVLFASIANNLLFNYVSLRYDSKGIIIYKLIISLYMYVIPVIPDVYIFMLSFYKMVCAYIVYIMMDKLFSKNDFVISYTEKRRMFIGNTIIMILTAGLIMLVSCEFKYGIMVIGSGSMTGTINEGDAVIFESYEDEQIQVGQVIIFDYNNIKAVHRVIKIVNVNGENRYFTKGDANKEQDEGYITQKDIYGLVKLRIKFIGYPTLFVKKLFE